MLNVSLAALPSFIDSPESVLPCCREDAELWFSDVPAQLELAKSHCRECPVRESCLAGAIKNAEPCGVWGGEIFDNGVIVAQKKPRGRPRKAQ
jgi:WhiB family redox-sensing transcriptional regulator